jgi:hypothetical protein
MCYSITPNLKSYLSKKGDAKPYWHSSKLHLTLALCSSFASRNQGHSSRVELIGHLSTEQFQA